MVAPTVLLLLARVLAAASPSALLAEIARTYQIEPVVAGPHFPVRTAHGLIDGNFPPPAALAAYMPVFAPEFSLYPPALTTAARLKRVVLCTDLAFAGQRRNAVPDFEHDTLYLDVSRGGYSRPYQRVVVHHEFFHLVDYRDDGELYRDDRWAALNPPGFRYGTGGAAAQGVATMSLLTDTRPGFLTGYAATGVEEDKAEVFAHLLVNADRVAERCRADVVLKAKVDRMKELVAAFCPDADAAFWERARTRPRTDVRTGPGQWETKR